MEKDFHYYLTYAVAKLTKLAKPDVVAYACQFVDDNNEGHFTSEQEDTWFPEKIKTKNGSYYYPLMTQSLSTKSLNMYVQKYVYIPFHFLPGGDEVKPINKKINKLSTIPNSGNARGMLSAALDSGDPYRIGIAMHTYADTWSHQNFSGLQEDWNSVYPWYNFFKSMVPNIGHAEAGHSPDVISEPWVDHRLGKGTIDNKQRAFDAVEKIYTAVQKKNNKGTPWNDVKDKFRKIIDAPDYDARIKMISGLVGGTIPAYSEKAWVEKAIKKEGDEWVMKPSFEKTDWYSFHQAAKAQFALVMDLVKTI